MEELKEALKKTKSGKSLGEVTCILNCINMQTTHFMGDCWFFK
jgi:DNA polymerase III sliding clamp (beta) subunit (PCNA family)